MKKRNRSHKEQITASRKINSEHSVISEFLIKLGSFKQSYLEQTENKN